MVEFGNPKMVEFSKDLKTPMDLSSVEPLMNDKCKLLESGKVLTKISYRKCCFQIYHMSCWQLYYVIRTTDDALIIFTAPKKGFVLSLNSALYLKIARSETSTGKQICKVKLKWKFGKVKLKFAENQICIWRQRFLTTFGHIDESNKNAMIITSKKQTDKANRRQIEHEELDITTSAMSLASNYNLHSYSSKSSEYLKHIGSITLYSDTEKNKPVNRQDREEQSCCNCRHLLGLINRSNNQYSNNTHLQNNPMKSISTIIKNSCNKSMENDNSAKKTNILPMQLCGKGNNFDKVNNNVKNNDHITSSSKITQK